MASLPTTAMHCTEAGRRPAGHAARAGPAARPRLLWLPGYRAA